MYEEALTMFVEMNGFGIGIDEVVLVSVLSACAHLSVVKTGKMFHGLSLRVGIDSYVNLQNALIHMYSTCGNILAAEEIFKVSYQLDQISWNSMISGYLKCGKSDKARELFDSMSEKDTVTWSLMISCHAQLEMKFWCSVMALSLHYDGFFYHPNWNSCSIFFVDPRKTSNYTTGKSSDRYGCSFHSSHSLPVTDRLITTVSYGVEGWTLHTIVKLFSCESLTSLQNIIWKLKCLQVLYLDGTSKLDELPEQLGKMGLKNSATMAMCSKCHKDMILKQEQAKIAATSI
ncbi:hypothetical protein ACET3Z_030849 [Daucus carota]